MRKSTGQRVAGNSKSHSVIEMGVRLAEIG
jgi:hypothetical protein